MKTFDSITSYTRRPNLSIRTSNSFLKNKIRGIAQENLYMLKRIVDKPPTYDSKKWIKDYNQNQKYKNNICKFPSINFYQKYKRKKNEMSMSKSKYSILNNDSINIRNAFPQIKSNSEVYPNRKYRIKNGKKRFEDFDYRDIMNIQIHKKNYQTNTNSTTNMQKSSDKELSEKNDRKNSEEDEKEKINGSDKENSDEDVKNKKENENEKSDNEGEKNENKDENMEENNNNEKSNEDDLKSNKNDNDESVNNESGNQSKNESKNDIESKNESKNENDNESKSENKDDNESKNDNDNEKSDDNQNNKNISKSGSENDNGSEN